jgi:hypothetical protein
MPSYVHHWSHPMQLASETKTLIIAAHIWSDTYLMTWLPRAAVALRDLHVLLAAGEIVEDGNRSYKTHFKQSHFQ